MSEKAIQKENLDIGKYSIATSDWTKICQLLFQVNDYQRIIDIIANKATLMRIATEKTQEIPAEDFIYIVTVIFVENRIKNKKKKKGGNKKVSHKHTKSAATGELNEQNQKASNILAPFIKSPKDLAKIQKTPLKGILKQKQESQIFIQKKARSRSNSPAPKSASKEKPQPLNLNDMMSQIHEIQMNKVTDPTGESPEPQAEPVRKPRFKRHGTVAGDNPVNFQKHSPEKFPSRSPSPNNQHVIFFNNSQQSFSKTPGNTVSRMPTLQNVRHQSTVINSTQNQELQKQNEALANKFELTKKQHEELHKIFNRCQKMVTHTNTEDAIEDLVDQMIKFQETEKNLENQKEKYQVMQKDIETMETNFENIAKFMTGLSKAQKKYQTPQEKFRQTELDQDLKTRITNWRNVVFEQEEKQ